MNRTRCFMALGFACLLYFGVLRTSRAAPTCPDYPRDETTTIQQGTIGDCGNTIWELKAVYGQDEYDEGEYDATGTCTGGYVNCNCTPVNGGFLAPTRTFQTYAFPGGDEYEWWWSITNYGGRYLNPCSGGNCQTNGYASEDDPKYVDSSAGWDDEWFDPCVY